MVGLEERSVGIEKASHQGCNHGHPARRILLLGDHGVRVANETIQRLAHDDLRTALSAWSTGVNRSPNPGVTLVLSRLAPIAAQCAGSMH